MIPSCRSGSDSGSAENVSLNGCNLLGQRRTMPGMVSVGSSLDAYRDVGARATQDAKAERRPSSCRGAVFCSESRAKSHTVRTWKFS